MQNFKKYTTFAVGKVLHDQLPSNPPGLDRSKGPLVERCDVDRLSFFIEFYINFIVNNMAKEEFMPVAEQHNVIANGTTVKGDITTNGDIRVDGSIEGTINSKGKVIIGEKGIVKGKIFAANIDIMGSVTGDMVATNTITLKSTAKVTGNIQTVTIVIEQNAVLNGNCKMGKFEPQAAPAPAPAADNAKK